MHIQSAQPSNLRIHNVKGKTHGREAMVTISVSAEDIGR